MGTSTTMHRLERFLRTEPNDAGCDETRRLLHVYVEELLRGGQPGVQHPDIAAHLRDCSPCADELEGLLAAVSAD
jgi:hypothetical protein